MQTPKRLEEPALEPFQLTAGPACRSTRRSVTSPTRELSARLGKGFGVFHKAGLPSTLDIHWPEDLPGLLGLKDLKQRGFETLKPRFRDTLDVEG